MVYLNVPPVLLYERTKHDLNRPLLQTADPLRKLEELHAMRDPLYREAAHIVVEGRAWWLSGIVAHLIREFGKACRRMQTLKEALGERSYPIYIGAGRWKMINVLVSI